MKKSVIVAIVVLALVILVSPGIVGMLAERVVDRQIEIVDEQNPDVDIRADRFDRGWFYSEGQHRVALEKLAGYAGDLVIETRIDHGLVPLSSITRQQGTLVPGLGSAVSTLWLETADGQRTDLPGAIYTDIALGGSTRSRYLLPAGRHDTIEWSDTEVRVNSDPLAATAEFDGEVASLSMLANGESQQLEGLAFDGKVAMTPYGFFVGDVNLAIEALRADNMNGPPVAVGPVLVQQSSALNGERLDGSLQVDIATEGMPGLSSMNLTIRAAVEGADAEAFGRASRAINAAPDTADPQAVLLYAEDELMDLFADGFGLRIDPFELTVPVGTLAANLAVDVPATDRDDFTWTSLLLAMEARADAEIPAAFYQLMSMMSPDVAQLETMGIFKLNGDVYEMNAVYRQGLLSINGAPYPIPLSMP